MSDITTDLSIGLSNRNRNSPGPASYFDNRADALNKISSASGIQYQETDPQALASAMRGNYAAGPLLIHDEWSEIQRDYEVIVNNPRFQESLRFSKDPEEDKAKVYAVSALAKYFDLSSSTVLEHYDELKNKVFGDGTDNKVAARQVANAEAVGRYNFEQAYLSNKWMKGTATEQDLERIRYLDAIMPEVDVQFKDIPLAFKTAFLQSWPMMRESATAGNVESLLTGAATGVLSGISAATASGATIQSVSAGAAIGMMKGFGAAKTTAAFHSMAEMESGLLFKRIMSLEGANGEKVDFDTARKYAAQGGAAIAAAEMLEVGTLIQAGMGKVAVGTLKAGLTTAKGWMSIMTGHGAEVAKQAFKSFGTAVFENVGEELGQDLISDFYTALAVKSTEDPEAFKHLKRSGKQIAEDYLNTAISSAILSAGLAIGPVSARAVTNTVQANIAVKDAVADAVRFGVENNTDVSAIMNRLREDPRVAGMNEQRVQKLVDIKSRGLELINALAIEDTVPNLEELYEKDAKRSYDKMVEEWTQNSPPPEYGEYYYGYMASVGKSVPPSTFSMEKTGKMYQELYDFMRKEGNTEAEIEAEIGTRMQYHEFVTGPERAFDAAMTVEGRAQYLRQMRGTVAELEEMSKKLKTGDVLIDKSMDELIQSLRQDTSISSYGITEGEAVATQKAIVEDEIRELNLQVTELKAEIASLYDENDLRYGAVITELSNVINTIAEKEEKTRNPMVLLEESGWKEGSLGKETTTVKDINLVEWAKINSYNNKIDEIRKARESMKRISPELQEQSDREIRILKQAIHNSEVKMRDIQDILMDAHRRKYIEFEKNIELEERVNRIAYLFELQNDPEYQALIEGGNPEALMSHPKFANLSDLEKFNMIYKHGKSVKEMDINNIVGLNKSKRAVGNALKKEYERIMGRIDGYETKNIPERRMVQIEVLKDLIRKNSVNDSVVNYVLSEVNTYVDKMQDKHPMTREDLQRTIPAFINELNLGAFNPGSDVKPISIQELNRVYRMIEFIRNVGAKEMVEKKTEAQIKADVMKTSIMDSLANKKEVGDMKKFVNGAVGTILHPVTFFRNIGGDSMVELFVKDKLYAKNKSDKEMIRRGESMAVVLKENGYKVKDLYKTMVVQGKEYTRQELMGIYLGMKNEYTEAAIINGTYSNGEKIPESVYSQIENHLSDEDKTIALAIEKDFQESWDRLSTAYEKSTGNRLGRQKVYMPMIWEYLDFDNLEEELLTQFMFGSDKKFSGVYNKNLKERIERQVESKAGIKLGLFDLWSDMMHKQEHYIASVENVEIMSRVLKDSEISRKISETFGKTVEQQGRKYVQNYASPASIYGTSIIDKTVRAIKGNLVFANLAFVPAIIARQAFSSPFYMMYSGGGNYMNAVGRFMKHPIDTLNWVKEVAPAVISSGAGFDMTKTKPSTYSGMKVSVGGNDIYLKEVKKTLNDIGMSGIQFVDQVAKAIGFVAVYDKFVEDIGHENAVREAIYVTDLTQPTNDKTALPDIYRQNSALDTLLMYSQQPLKILNMITSEFGQKAIEGKENPKAYVELLLGVTAVTISTLGIWVMKNRRAPEDEREFLEVLISSFISDVPLIGRSVMSGVNGYSSTSQFFDPLKAVGILATDRDYEQKVKAVIDGLAVGTGLIPTNMIDKAIKAVEDEDILNILIGVKTR